MEVVARATIVFFGLVLLLRAVGKRELSQLTSFELLMIVLIGDLSQPAITQEDMSIVGAALSIGTVAFWVMMLSYVTFRWPRSEKWLEGQPTIVIRDGKVLDELLHIERVSFEELLTAARQRGIGDLRDVEIGVLEADGQFSFILRKDDQRLPADPPRRTQT